MHCVKCNDMYEIPEYQFIKSIIEEQRQFIQVVMGARQIPATNSAWISDCWVAVRSLNKPFLTGKCGDIFHCPVSDGSMERA